jgi:hypothetical protein
MRIYSIGCRPSFALPPNCLGSSFLICKSTEIKIEGPGCSIGMLITLTSNMHSHSSCHRKRQYDVSTLDVFARDSLILYWSK